MAEGERSKEFGHSDLLRLEFEIRSIRESLLAASKLIDENQKSLEELRDLPGLSVKADSKLDGVNAKIPPLSTLVAGFLAILGTAGVAVWNVFSLAGPMEQVAAKADQSLQKLQQTQGELAGYTDKFKQSIEFLKTQGESVQKELKEATAGLIDIRKQLDSQVSKISRFDEIVSRVLVRLDSLQTNTQTLPVKPTSSQPTQNLETMILDLLGDNAPRYQRLLVEAKKEIESDNFLRGRELLEQAKNIDPDKTQAIYDFMVAQSYYQQENYDLAIEHYNIAIGLESDVASFYNNKGTALFAKSQQIDDQNEKTQLLEEAIASHKRAFELEPGDETVAVNLALNYIVICDIDTAIATLKSASKQDSGELLYTYAMAYAAKGNVTDSIDLLSRAVDSNPMYGLRAIAEERFTILREKGPFKEMINQKLGPEVGMAAAETWGQNATSSSGQILCH